MNSRLHLPTCPHMPCAQDSRLLQAELWCTPGLVVSSWLVQKEGASPLKLEIGFLELRARDPPPTGAHRLLKRPLGSHSPSETAGAEAAPSSPSAAMTPRSLACIVSVHAGLPLRLLTPLLQSGTGRSFAPGVADRSNFRSDLPGLARWSQPGAR